MRIGGHSIHGTAASSSGLQLPLLCLRAIAYRHGDITFLSYWLGDSCKTLTDRDLVDPVGLLQETQKTLTRDTDSSS